ncbi:MAG: hypothetical protein ABSA03_10940, partial [Streptosporangiaceae bacterium]
MRAWQVLSRGWPRTRSLARGVVAVIVPAVAVLAAVPAAAMVAPGAAPASGWGRYAAEPKADVRGADLVDASTGAQLWGKDASV